MDQTNVRMARPNEIERARTVLELSYGPYEAVMPAENWTRYRADILDIEGRTPPSELWVAERDGDIIGCVSYYPPGAAMSYPSEHPPELWPTEWAAFRLLGVDPSAAGGGVGRLLTEFCVRRAREQEAPAIGLHTTPFMTVARAMYQRMGFERAERFDFHPAPSIIVEAYRMPL
jgi:GNAT superfamily N-acetyltransferase